jgi:putative transcriptional regulator
VVTNIVYELRTQNGMTQEQLAQRLHVTRQTIISLERNRYVPSLEMGFKVARLFSRTVDQVFSYVEGK